MPRVISGIRGRFALDQQRRGLSARTVHERDLVLRRLEVWVEGVPLLALKREDIELWLDSCDIGSRARSVYLSAIDNFYDWALLEELRPDNPTIRIRRPILPRMTPRPIPDDELLRAIFAAPPMIKAWLSLAAYQGFRCKEIAGLRREDVFEAQRRPLLRVSNGKGGHQAILPMNTETLVALRQHGLPVRGSVFLRPSGKPYSAGRVSQLGNRYLHDLGIEETMHQLRHWFGTAVWAATKDMRVTQEMMRHSDPATTAGYAAFDQQLAAKVVTELRVRS